MTGFNSKRQAAQDKMELADAYALTVAETPHMPTPLERRLSTERIERARNALEAALEQQAEPVQERITRIAWDERGVRTVNDIPDDAPQRQWVGLEAEDLAQIESDEFWQTGNHMAIAVAVEAKLKERNHD